MYENTQMAGAVIAAALLLLTLPGCSNDTPTDAGTDQEVLTVLDDMVGVDWTPKQSQSWTALDGKWAVNYVHAYKTDGNAVTVESFQPGTATMEFKGITLTLKTGSIVRTYTFYQKLADRNAFQIYSVRKFGDAYKLANFFTIEYKTLDDGSLQLDANTPFFMGRGMNITRIVD